MQITRSCGTDLDFGAGRLLVGGSALVLGAVVMVLAAGDVLLGDGSLLCARRVLGSVNRNHQTIVSNNVSNTVSSLNS